MTKAFKVKLCTATLVALMAFNPFNFAQAQNAPPAAPVPAPAVNAASASAPMVALPDFTKVVAETENAVVNIRTMEKVRDQNGGQLDLNNPDDLLRFFFGPDFPGVNPQQRQQPRAPQGPETEHNVPRGIGSGFIISKDGFILTNNHVVAGSSKIMVTLNDGKEYPAKIIGTDERTDVALIKIEAKDLPILKLGDSDLIKKGQWVLAIGSPFGLDSTVTAGIVSAINRDTGDYLPFIQTDVAVNPGNSGGPLINLNGEVVGINSQIVSRSGGFMGISLAIPIDEVMRVVDQLRANGKVTRGRIGVQIGEVSNEVAKALGLPQTNGALVSGVEQNSPADKAGVQPGDVILKFNGQAIKRWSDLPRVVGLSTPGKEASLEVWRRGKLETLNVQVDEFTSTANAGKNTDNQAPTPAIKDDRLGLSVGPIPSDSLSQLRIKGGVIILEAKGPAAEAGIAKNDIVLAVNDKDVLTVAQYQAAIDGLKANTAAALLIRRDNVTQWVPVTPTK